MLEKEVYMKKRTFLNTGLILSSLIYLFFAFKNELIPMKLHLIGFGVILLLIVLGIYLKNRLAKSLIMILVVLLSLVHVQAQNLLSSIFVNAEDELLTRQAKVSLIALKERDITENDLKTVVYGTSNNLDVHIYEYVREEIATKYNVVPNIVNTTDNLELTRSLLNQEIDVMVLDETQREAILQEYPGFNEVTHSILSLEKEIILESNAIKVNPKEESFVVLLTANDNWGEKDAQSLADVNILAIVNPKLSQFTLVSVPRDTFVPLACKDQAYDKLTHTGFYGIDCQIETISNYMNIDINYYAKVNFGTLVNIINIIGGSVNVYNPYAFQGHTEEYYFEEGCLNLDALATLNYVRTRYELPDGDFGRQENQKRVIKSLVSKMTTPHRILNMGSLFSALSKEVETNIDVNFVNTFVSHQLDKWPNWQMNSLHFNGYDGEEITYSFPYEYLYVFLPDHTELSKVKADIKQFMNAKSIEEVDFLNPVPIVEETPTQNEVDVQPDSVVEETPPQNDVVKQPDPQEPMSTPEPEIYKPIIDNSIEKFGIHIFPFELENQDTFTKQQYIEACEASYGW